MTRISRKFVVAVGVLGIPMTLIAQQIAEHGNPRMAKTALWLVLLLGWVLVAFRLIVGRRLADITRHFREAARADRDRPLEPVAVRGKDEIAELARGFNALAARERAAYEDLEHRVRARTKELNCLYGLSKLVEADGATLDSVAGGLVHLLAESWRHPKVACARIAIGATEYAAGDFGRTESRLSSPIRVGGREAGRVEVGRLAGKGEADDEPFLDEERALLDAVAERLARVVEQKKRDAQLARLNRGLIEVSRRTGMAEVATGVLHSVGNVLNSVNVSANVALDKLRGDHAERLCGVADMLDENAGRLAEFFSRDKRGRRMSLYLRALGSHLAEERGTVRCELAGLLEKIEHIKEIVSMQQAYGQLSGAKEPIRLDEALDAALKLNDASFVRHNVEIVREYGDFPPVPLVKHALLQVLVNLISNAKQAVKDSARDDKRIALRIRRGNDGFVAVEVADNGVGIPPEDLDRVFEYGYSTRPGGHGFGLHSSALAARDLGGRLEVYSDGADRGARFCLHLPLTIEEEALCPA